MSGMNRRGVLGLGAAAAAVLTTGATGGTASAETADRSGRIDLVYRWVTERAGGTWNSVISVAGSDVVADGADELVEAYSVNKIAVAVAVLDKVDRGLVALDQRLEVTKDIVIPSGDGIFRLDGAYPSSVTVGHALAALLTVSDDTAVRLSGLVCPARELNEILVAKGFPKTQVVPVANPNRFFLGKTTPRETHDLVRRLVAGELLTPASTAFLLSALRSPIAFTDGVRREMSSAERARIATKAGWFNDGRNEAGVLFGASGGPVLIYSIFARGQAQPENFGATHPAVSARAVLGRAFLAGTAGLDTAATSGRSSAVEYAPSNGG